MLGWEIGIGETEVPWQMGTGGKLGEPLICQGN